MLPAWTAPLESLLFVVLPTSVLVAVTRYRFYEIDRIISRTVGYALISALLVCVYLLVAIVPTALFDIESDLLVAGATLAAAAAFVPVRRRVQQLVDRRFKRARYDAAQVVERFGEPAPPRPRPRRAALRSAGRGDLYRAARARVIVDSGRQAEQ